jgi:hypothetical protein
MRRMKAKVYEGIITRLHRNCILRLDTLVIDTTHRNGMAKQVGYVKLSVIGRNTKEFIKHTGGTPFRGNWNECDMMERPPRRLLPSRLCTPKPPLRFACSSFSHSLIVADFVHGLVKQHLPVLHDVTLLLACAGPCIFDAYP